MGVTDTGVDHGEVAVGMAGTFDVENYGDLLFPLIAAEALKRRDPRIRVVPFSPNGKSTPSWPFPVRPVTELIASMSTLSAMLIGGGQIVRFDALYPVPTPANVDLPFAYWLIPAVLAAVVGKPVIWNAVGATIVWPRDPWHCELMREVLAASYFIGVRDVPSRDVLARVAPDANVQFLPDTAFGVSRVWPLGEETVEFAAWRASMGLKRTYIVIQASGAVGTWRATIESVMASRAEDEAVILPVCWCHGDRAAAFPALRGRVVVSGEWLAPRLISEIIGRAELIVASSLHACITALSYGVPAVRVPVAWGPSKFAQLDEFAGIAPIDDKQALSRLIRRGRTIEPRAIEHADRLDRYWDEVRDVALHPPVEHCNRARTVLLSWITKACGDRRHQGFARRFIVPLRIRLVRYFPNQRLAVRRWLFLLKSLAVAAFQKIAGIGGPPIAEPKDSP